MPQSNIFEAGAAEIPQLFGDYIEGATAESACVVLTLSTTALAGPARDAVDKSLHALGYAAEACSYATMVPLDGAAEGSDIALDPQSLFLIVEGLDPLRLIIADRGALDLVSKAYRSDFQADSALRVFGRPTAAFDDLATLVQTPDGKQKAWRILKSLAR